MEASLVAAAGVVGDTAALGVAVVEKLGKFREALRDKP
jgi:hypothetical protein